MSEILRIGCYSAPDGQREVAVFEFRNPAIDNDGRVFICSGFDDLEVGLDTGETVFVKALGLGVNMPARSASGAQELGISVDNVLGLAYPNIKAAEKSGEPLQVIHYAYMAPDFTRPIGRPNRATVVNGEMVGGTLQMRAAYRDLINYAFNRETFDFTRFPGLKYT